MPDNLPHSVKLNDEVREALERGAPVVALESTIIAHGMPYPQNLETAARLETILREAGAVPATVAILDGTITVGLGPDELEKIAHGADFLKVSRRDLPVVVSQKLNGATTVASTMIIADLAGIAVFVTGGIGGVHRGAPLTFDISADLTELARSNVAVVCAGAKAILDIGLTLEFLETQGVPVIGYRTTEFPAFYTSTSGFELEHTAESAFEIAKTLQTKWSLGLAGGVVIGNPIPQEFEMDPNIIQDAIAQAIDEAEKQGIRGKKVTPFLLATIEALTGGDSLSANIELVCHNAQLGGEIAREYARLQANAAKRDDFRA